MKTSPWFLLALACACSSGPAHESPGGSGPAAGTSGNPSAGSGGNAVGPIPASSASALAFKALKQEAEAAESLDQGAALASYPTDFLTSLSYDPSTAIGLDTIQGSALALSEGELAKLGQQGFVVSTRREFPTFLRGLAEIYSEHLPLYVTADAILESVHSSYDAILLDIERAILLPRLRDLLAFTHQRIAEGDAPASVKADADVYFAIARSLLVGRVQAPLAGGDETTVTRVYLKALAAEGNDVVELFGVEREEDFSQFTPRGHYSGEPQLEQYFRAMMWLGRVDFRLIETLPNGQQVFRPDQYQAMLAIHAALAPDMSKWRQIDDAIRSFVGESDYMIVPEVQSLIDDLGGLEAAKSASDQAVTAAIVAGGYGEQQICSHLMVNDGTVDELPLNRSFLVFGQRYIPDSHVFSEVVYDRLPDGPTRRMMPSPLDAAFAALGNNHALALNQEELDKNEALPGALARMRVLIDSHDEAFWSANFYNLWLSALRMLSPAEDLSSTEGLPEVAKTEAWGRRMLNAQLGSWAELRHDTLLYAKQSYTSIPACEFPDAYVDPYPEFYAAIVRYAEQGSRIAEIAEGGPVNMLGPKITAYFDALRSVAARLGEMAEAQRRGETFTEEQLAFINDAVRVDEEADGCVTTEHANGWYADLFYDRDKSLEFDPTIADVHTQPADEGGAIVGKVLHVGTGYPRYLVTAIDTCSGPRAYAGVVYAYHEHITEDFERLTDEQWSGRLQSGDRPAEVPWLSDVLAQ